MPTLHLFNPENDLALAANEPNYTPPAAALRLRKSGALLPMWWANEGDAILVEDSSLAAEALRLRSEFGLHGHIVTEAPAGFTPSPWGWSIYTRRLFSRAGIPENRLPDDNYIRTVRTLSHRRTTIHVHHLLGTPDHLVPIEAGSLEDAIDAIDRFGRAVIKLPWSSSGRGILYSADIPRDTLADYIRGIIKRQGSAMIEPYYDRMRDFAALFYSDKTTASIAFRGLSLFATDRRGFYTGNLIMTQPDISHAIGIDLTDTIASLSQALGDVIAPHYNGWLGVDMLSHRSPDGSVQIAPCIEINLRRTMGIAALHISHTLAKPGQSRILTVGRAGIQITE